MAKKVRSRPEESEEHRFEFPVFDEEAFIRHELDLTWGMAMAVVIAIVAGTLSALLSAAGGAALPVVAPVGLGILLIVASPFLYLRLRPSAESYTKGDWAGMVALEVFGWLGVWFLLISVIGVR